MLPLSHDEVVHGKGSLLARMPGDRHQHFANLRLLYVCMWTYPGKKLLFMGNEFAQEREWNFAGLLDWELLGQLEYRGVHALIGDLNGLYRSLACLHAHEFSQEGFEWLDCHDPAQSVIVYLRRCSDRHHAVVVFNFAATVRVGYRVGVPQSGVYREILNSDATRYGGNGGTNGDLCALPIFHMGQPYSLVLNLPPLTGVVLVPDQVELEEDISG
jgi:1,4-alpha-glucan branching enzyme